MYIFTHSPIILHLCLFNRAWATVEGLTASGLYVFALDAARNNLAISASEDGLSLLSEEYDVPRRKATAWRGTAVIALAEGVPLPAGTVFIAENGFKYETAESVTGSDTGTVTVGLVCKQAGPDGNITAGETLVIQTVIEGAGCLRLSKEYGNSCQKRDFLVFAWIYREKRVVMPITH